MMQLKVGQIWKQCSKQWKFNFQGLCWSFCDVNFWPSVFVPNKWTSLSAYRFFQLQLSSSCCYSFFKPVRVNFSPVATFALLSVGVCKLHSQGAAVSVNTSQYLSFWLHFWCNCVCLFTYSDRSRCLFTVKTNESICYSLGKELVCCCYFTSWSNQTLKNRCSVVYNNIQHTRKFHEDLQQLFLCKYCFSHSYEFLLFINGQDQMARIYSGSYSNEWIRFWATKAHYVIYLLFERQMA